MPSIDMDDASRKGPPWVNLPAPNRGNTRRLRMLSIRKFVGCVKVAAGLGAAALGLGLSIQVAGAHVAAAPATQAVRVTTLSQPCQDALQAVRDFLVSDRQEDGVELATPPTSDTDEDAG